MILIYRFHTPVVCVVAVVMLMVIMVVSQLQTGLRAGASSTSTRYTASNNTDFGTRNLNGVNFTNANLANVDIPGVTSGGITGNPSVLPIGWKLMNCYLVEPKNNSWDHCTAITTRNAFGVKLRGYAKKSSHLSVYAIFRTENNVRSIW